MEVKDIRDIMTGKEYGRDGIDFLSTGALKIVKDMIVPEQVIEWSRALMAHTTSLLYLVRMGSRYGVMAVNEYDFVTKVNLYSGDTAAMQAGMRRNAETISGLECAKDFQIYVGAGTGYAGGDEICALIPFETPHEKACALLEAIDANVYAVQSEGAEIKIMPLSQ